MDKHDDKDYDDGYIKPVSSSGNAKYDNAQLPNRKSTGSEHDYLEIEDDAVQNKDQPYSRFEPGESGTSVKGAGKRYIKRWVLLVILIAVLLILIIIALVIAFVVLRKKDSEENKNDEFSDCNIIIITDEWNPDFTNTLITAMATQLNNSSPDTRLGLITQTILSGKQQYEFNITLRSPDDFLFQLELHKKEFCCAVVSDLIRAAWDMFDYDDNVYDNMDRRNILIFISLYESYFREQPENIKATANSVRENGRIDRIITAAYDWNSAQTDKTEQKAEAVTLDDSDIYSYKSDFNSQIAAAKDIVKSLSC